MSGSLNIGTYAGIPVKVHWTFSIVILFVAYIAFSENLSINESLVLSLYVISLFFCVILHEYGHALSARKYGVKTRDIILSPIGGLARLDYIPAVPKQELIIAIAGPLVNIVLAILILAVILIAGPFDLPSAIDLQALMNPIGFLQVLFILNIVLFGFNLIPAFPMDGGRILRALLSFKLPRLKGTFIASLIGRFIAVIFVVFGALNEYYALLFIGIFVYVSANREYLYLKYQMENASRIQSFAGREEELPGIENDSLD